MTLLLTALGAAALSAGLIVVLMPLLKRYALARPNARSSHTVPTPQGGGIAVMAATLAASAVALAALGLAPDTQLWVLAATAVALAVVGAVDDIVHIAAGLRLILQFVAVGAVVAALQADLDAVPALPPDIERPLLLVAGVWFVNLANFMDGLDWMTVTETTAVCVGLIALAALGALPPAPTVVTAALLGAMLGFAPFNKPVARLFLGDVGSLPLGLLLFWLLVQLAGRGHAAAALLLPLYYLADATITLGRRLARREKVWDAHRTHFYQIATARGLAVPAVIVRVAAADAGLVALALLHAAIGDIAALAAGALIVAVLLYDLTRRR